MGKPRQVVVEGEGSCFMHGHFFGEMCPKCETGKQQGLAARAAGKVRPLRHRALQNDPPTVLQATPKEVARYAGGRMPVQKPGKSEQSVGTPWDFIHAVERRWGKLTWDLAATSGNAKAPKFFTPKRDSLKKKWRSLEGNLWLNPPFGNIAPWAAKCAFSVPDRRFDHLFFLVPASTGTQWFLDSIYHKARVCFLKGRLVFEGHAQGYPKDLMLCVWGKERPGFEVWDPKTGDIYG